MIRQARGGLGLAPTAPIVQWLAPERVIEPIAVRRDFIDDRVLTLDSWLAFNRGLRHVSSRPPWFEQS
jgi:hypothetical protein